MILGIDPGLQNTGWAIVNPEPLKLIDCGLVKIIEGEERLWQISKQIGELIKQYQVTEMAIETLFFAKNAKSAIKVAEAIGVIKVCGFERGLDVVGYTPLEVKMALVGYGRAEKEQVEIMVRQSLNIDKSIKPSHAADAVAVALTHAFTMRI